MKTAGEKYQAAAGDACAAAEDRQLRAEAEAADAIARFETERGDLEAGE